MPSPHTSPEGSEPHASQGTPEKCRVVCVAGSPRRDGNSMRLARECEQGVRDAGATPVEIVVVDLDIAPCRGCNSCSRTGACVVLDRMSEVYSAFDTADAIIVSSPVFFATVPATLKALYDRCQPYWARTHVLGLPRGPRRPGGLILVRGGGDPFGFRAAVDTTKSVFAVLGLDYLAECKIAGPDRAGDVEALPEALAEARALGRRVAEEAIARKHNAS